MADRGGCFKYSLIAPRTDLGRHCSCRRHNDLIYFKCVQTPPTRARSQKLTYVHGAAPELSIVSPAVTRKTTRLTTPGRPPKRPRNQRAGGVPRYRWAHGVGGEMSITPQNMGCRRKLPGPYTHGAAWWVKAPQP